MPESPDCGSWARWRSDPIRRARPGVVGWDVELGHRAERETVRDNTRIVRVETRTVGAERAINGPVL